MKDVHGGRKESHEWRSAYQCSSWQIQLSWNPSKITCSYLLSIQTERFKSICALLKQDNVVIANNPTPRWLNKHGDGWLSDVSQYETPGVIFPFSPVPQFTSIPPLDPEFRYSGTKVLKRRPYYPGLSFAQLQLQDDGNFCIHFNRKLAEVTIPNLFKRIH